MNNWFKNLVSIGLILIYSISLSITIQDYLIDSILNKEQNHDISINLSDSKVPVFYLISNLEPVGDVINKSFVDFQTADFKAPFQYFNYSETYTLTIDKQYLLKSKNIKPGLDIETLLYPFHTFS